MAYRALTEEAVLAGLQDIRLPPEAPGGLTAELFVAIGIGLLLATAFGLLSRLMTRARRSEWQAAAGPLARMPVDARRLELLRRLKQMRPDTYAALAARLYAPGGLPDIAMLEAEIGRGD